MLLSPSCPATRAEIRVTSIFIQQPLSSHHSAPPSFRLKPLRMPSSKRRVIIPRRTQFPQDNSLPIGQTRPLRRPPAPARQTPPIPKMAADTASTTSLASPTVLPCRRAIRLRQDASTTAPSRSSNGSKPCGKNYETKPISAEPEQNATTCANCETNPTPAPLSDTPCGEQRGCRRAIEEFEPLKALREKLRNEANYRGTRTKCNHLRKMRNEPNPWPTLRLAPRPAAPPGSLPQSAATRIARRGGGRLRPSGCAKPRRP